MKIGASEMMKEHILDVQIRLRPDRQGEPRCDCLSNLGGHIEQRHALAALVVTDELALIRVALCACLIGKVDEPALKHQYYHTDHFYHRRGSVSSCRTRFFDQGAYLRVQGCGMHVDAHASTA